MFRFTPLLADLSVGKFVVRFRQVIGRIREKRRQMLIGLTRSQKAVVSFKTNNRRLHFCEIAGLLDSDPIVREFLNAERLAIHIRDSLEIKAIAYTG